MNLSRQITERAPHFAHGWAEHAYDLASKSLWLPPKLADAYVAQARTESDRALAINPHDGLAYTARLITMEYLPQFAQREALIRRGLMLAPTNAPLYMAKANDMWGLGRLQDALEAARHSSQYDGFLPGMVVEEAGIDGDLGDSQAAHLLLERAQTLWPHQRWVDRLAYRLALYWGNPDDALKLIEADRIVGYPDSHLRVDRAYAAWRKAPSEATAAAAGRVIEDEAAKGLPEPEYVQLLAAMGQIDAAYALAARLPAEDHGDPGWYRDYVAPFRADRRFMPLAARLGLARIWLQTGLWPDFCRNEHCPTTAGLRPPRRSLLFKARPEQQLANAVARPTGQQWALRSTVNFGPEGSLGLLCANRFNETKVRNRRIPGVLSASRSAREGVHGWQPRSAHVQSYARAVKWMCCGPSSDPVLPTSTMFSPAVSQKVRHWAVSCR